MKKQILLIICMSILVSCNGYQLMFNSKPIYSPPQIYSNFSVEDKALQNCLTQTLVDQNITDIRDLQILNCSYAGIENLSGLTHFKWLKTINLSNNNLSDIKPLMFLGLLQEVNLEGNNLLPCADLTALENFISDRLLAPKACLN